jgi:3-methyladenine DNA glycosylase Tag
MIRSRKKVLATLRNARELVDKVKVHGSVHSYIASFGTDTQALIDELDGWVTISARGRFAAISIVWGVSLRISLWIQ